MPMSVVRAYTDSMSQIEVSPGGIGFVRAPAIRVPGVPESAKRQPWAVSGTPESKPSKRVFPFSRRGSRSTD
jgi:hypothetical protein